MQLDTGQTLSLDKLIGKLAARKDALADPSANRGPSEGSVAYDVEVGNVLGLLGPRGGGKSTLLNALCDRRKDLGGLVFSPPLDCSLVPSDVAPGSALLLCLEERIKEANDVSEERRKSLEKSIHDLAARYAQSSRRYRTLRMELSSSPEAYTRALLDDAQKRLKLRRELTDWLDSALAVLRQRAFVVPLDDFDLVPSADQVRRWMLSLLDELQQPRLLVVLTADYYRLEHLSWDPKVEVDDKTGRALLAKLLPPQNRIHLSRWTRPSREDFKLFAGPAGPPNLALGQLVDRYSVGLRAQRLLLRRLLPRWPRGLRNLFLSLVEEPEDRTPDRLDASRFLAVLANCRGEPILARKLAASPLGSWVRRLRFANEELSEEAWQETVEAACQRARGEIRAGDLRPIEALNPHTAWARSQSPPRTGEAAVDDYAALLIEMPERLHPLEEESAERDPLRHGYLRVLPLGDADSSARPFWTELLIGYGLHVCEGTDGSGEPPSLVDESARSVVGFLAEWSPIAARLRRTAFEVVATRSQLRSFLSTPSVQRHRAALAWLAWESSDEASGARVGWQPLLDVLRGARDLLPSRLLDDLGTIDPGRFSGEAPAFGTSRELAVVPREVWALVMLVEGLRRCPWVALSGSRTRGWEITTHIGLAAAFVRSAYVYALIRSGQYDAEKLLAGQRAFYDLLDSRDARPLLASNEEEVLHQVAEAFADPLDRERLEESDPLVRATRAFLRSNAYLAVVDLVATAPKTPSRDRRRRKRE